MPGTYPDDETTEADTSEAETQRTETGVSTEILTNGNVIIDSEEYTDAKETPDDDTEVTNEETEVTNEDEEVVDGSVIDYEADTPLLDTQATEDNASREVLIKILEDAINFKGSSSDSVAYLKKFLEDIPTNYDTAMPQDVRQDTYDGMTDLIEELKEDVNNAAGPEQEDEKNAAGPEQEAEAAKTTLRTTFTNLINTINKAQVDAKLTSTYESLSKWFAIIKTFIVNITKGMGIQIAVDKQATATTIPT